MCLTIDNEQYTRYSRSPHWCLYSQFKHSFMSPFETKIHSRKGCENQCKKGFVEAYRHDIRGKFNENDWDEMSEDA